ncbi:MAG: zinc ribbon domain-containing protein [Methanobrevibacter sp.]|nr:zinc ribbon domain-containing protein [Methanobrevibacter sp.]
MEVEASDIGAKKIKKSTNTNNSDKNLEKGIKTTEEGEKLFDKDSKIIEPEQNIKRLENEVNRYEEPKFCPKCGANTKPNFKFCNSCGHLLKSFKQTENEVNNDGPRFCTKCGLITKPNYKFCKSCGHHLISFKHAETEINNGTTHIAKESKTKDLSKAFKISIPPINNNDSEKSIKQPVESTKQENTNLNIDENAKANNKGNIDSVEKDIKEENNISYSTADEINKFYELKKKGIITSEEFEKKKKQLLDL